MKRILTYSLFESDEYGDEAPEGFVYSEREVIDFLGDQENPENHLLI